VSALLNDTVGVMAAGRYYDPATEIGMIIGTGTNACYVEKVRAGVLPHALLCVLVHALLHAL
jgi:hexokinase